VLEGWSYRDHPNFFFTTYEEMSQDLRGVAQRLIKFLGKGMNIICSKTSLKSILIKIKKIMIQI